MESWCSCQLTPPEPLLCLRAAVGMENLGSSVCSSWAKPPNSPIPSGSRLLLLQNLLRNWNFWSLPELSGEGPTSWESCWTRDTSLWEAGRAWGGVIIETGQSTWLLGNCSLPWPFPSDYSKQDNPCLLRSLACYFPFPLDVVCRFKGSSTALCSWGGAGSGFPADSLAAENENSFCSRHSFATDLNMLKNNCTHIIHRGALTECVCVYQYLYIYIWIWHIFNEGACVFLHSLCFFSCVANVAQILFS